MACRATSDDDDVDEDDQDESLESTTEAEEKKGCLERLETSAAFRFIITAAILLNTVVMALEADAGNRKDRAESGESGWGVYADWDFYNDVLLLVFTMELLLRLVVYRFSFFCNADWRWNWFDFCLVALGLAKELGSHGSHSSLTSFFVRQARMLRLLRILRAVRLLNFFPDLQRLMTALVSSVQSVAWIALFFLILVFVFATFVNTVVGTHVDVFDEEDKDDIQVWFGGTFASAATLFVFLTLDDWSTPARVVNKKIPWMWFTWVSFIVAGAFMILSLLTGLMADKMASAREEMDEQKTSPEETMVRLEQFRHLYAKAEGLSKSDFSEMVTKPDVAEFLEDYGVKLHCEAARDWLFRSIDTTGDGRLTWDEVARFFKEISKHTEAGSALKELMWMEGTLARLDHLLADDQARRATKREATAAGEKEVWEAKLDDVHDRASLLRRRLTVLEGDLEDFLRVKGPVGCTLKLPTSVTTSTSAGSLTSAVQRG